MEAACNPATLNHRQIESQALFDGAKELTIVHQAQIYSLRITNAGKLILTK